MIIREIGASLRALFTRLPAKTTTIAGTESVYLDDAGASVKAALSDAIRYGGGNSARIATIGNANVHQNSTGAMWLEVAGQTAGNARGAGAFDWQAVRTNAANVASGANAIALGKDARASGAYAFAVGNLCSATANSSLAGGESSTASGVQAFAYGNACSAVARESTAINLGAYTHLRGQFAVGATTTPGAIQANILPTFTVTTDATPTPLNINNTASARLTIEATRSVAFIGIVQAMALDSGTTYKVKAWKIEGVIMRDTSTASTTRIVGTPTITVIAQDTDGTATPSTWSSASITADTTNGALAVNVTGQAGQTIRWQASLFYSQVGF
jgi:hypothetical protein